MLSHSTLAPDFKLSHFIPIFLNRQEKTTKTERHYSTSSFPYLDASKMIIGLHSSTYRDFRCPSISLIDESVRPRSCGEYRAYILSSRHLSP